MSLDPVTHISCLCCCYHRRAGCNSMSIDCRAGCFTPRGIALRREEPVTLISRSSCYQRMAGHNPMSVACWAGCSHPPGVVEGGEQEAG